MNKQTDNKYREAANRLVGYLADEYDEAGASRSAPDNVQFYYKMPATFEYAGRRGLAMRTLDQFVTRFLAGDKFLLEGDPIAKPWSAYLAGSLGWGAGSLGRFDIARCVSAAVASRQDPVYGGFIHDDPKAGQIMDLERTSSALMGCVWAGRINDGLRAARFMANMLALQPDSDVYYAYLGTGGGIVKDNADRNGHYRKSDEHARPALFATSIAGLTWLGRATGESWVFEIAERYLQLTLSLEHDAATRPLATKTGWCALMLAQHLEDNESIIEFARRSGDALVERQQEDGSIDFDAIPDVPHPIDKIWHIGWGCDAALTLLALADL